MTKKFTGEYTIEGKITEKTNPETINFSSGSFEKMDFVINTKIRAFEFGHDYKFEITGEEKINLLKDAIKVGNIVEITFYIKSRQWNEKFYYSLIAKDIRTTIEETFENKNHQDDEKNLPF